MQASLGTAAVAGDSWCLYILPCQWPRICTGHHYNTYEYINAILPYTQNKTLYI